MHLISPPAAAVAGGAPPALVLKPPAPVHQQLVPLQQARPQPKAVPHPQAGPQPQVGPQPAPQAGLIPGPIPQAAGAGAQAGPQLPTDQEWIWVQAKVRQGRCTRATGSGQSRTRTTNPCQLCRRNWPLQPPPPPRMIGTSTPQDAAEQQEEIWVEILKNLDDLFQG